MPRSCSCIITHYYKSFKRASRELLENFKRDSRELQRASREFHESFNWVSSGFQKSFKRASRELLERAREFNRVQESLRVCKRVREEGVLGKVPFGAKTLLMVHFNWALYLNNHRTTNGISEKTSLDLAITASWCLTLGAGRTSSAGAGRRRWRSGLHNRTFLPNTEIWFLISFLQVRRLQLMGLLPKPEEFRPARQELS